MALRVVFAGTPAFAAQSLQALLDSQHDVAGVYTQPDRPAGRGRHLQASEVKQLAEQAGLPVYQPETFKDPGTVAGLQALQPDVMAVVVYGQLLPQAVIDVPRFGCLNIHPSLLPRWRGAAPIQHALLAGDAQTGVSIMQLDVGMDTGPVLMQEAFDLDGKETAGSLHQHCAEMGARMLVTVLDQIDAQGQVVAEPQEDALATIAGKIHKADAKIDWQRSAVEIDRQIRAYNPMPVAFAEIADTRLRTWSAEVVSAEGMPGEILDQPEAIVVACSHGALKLLEVQLPGGKVCDAKDVLHGHPQLFAPGQYFRN